MSHTRIIARAPALLLAAALITGPPLTLVTGPSAALMTAPRAAFLTGPRAAFLTGPPVIAAPVSGSGLSPRSDLLTETGRVSLAGEPAVEPDAIRGRGWASIAGCLTCIGGGVYLLTSGKVALMTAFFREGSALALASCVAACSDAIR